MTRRQIQLVLSALTVCLLLVPARTASACVVMSRVRVNDMPRADVVFKGEVVSYNLIPRKVKQWREYGLVSFRVIETYMGERRPNWEIYFQPASFAVPDSWRLDKTVIVAGYWMADTFPEHLKHRLHRPELLRPIWHCTTHPFLRADDETVSGIRRVLEYENDPQRWDPRRTQRSVRVRRADGTIKIVPLIPDTQ